MCRNGCWLTWMLSGALASLPLANASADEPVVEPPPPTVAPETPSGTTAPVPTPGVVLASPVVSTSVRRTDIAYKRPRVGLLAGGLSLFAVGWVADIGFTYGYGHQPGWTSIIPIAGPFIQLTQTYGLDGPAIDTGSSDADARANKTLDSANATIKALAFTGAILCGIAQITGFALTIAGASTKRKTVRYVTAATTFDGAVLRF